MLNRFTCADGSWWKFGLFFGGTRLNFKTADRHGVLIYWGGGEEMALFAIRVRLQCCARFSDRTLNCTSLLTWRRELSFQNGGKKNQALQLEVIMSQTHEHLLIPFYLWEKLLYLFLHAYFQLLEWTPGLRNTASALPAQFPARSSSLTGAARKWPWQGLWCSYGHSSLCYMGSFRQCCAALSPIHLPIQVLLICWLTNLQRHYAELRIPADSITVKGQGGSGLRLQAQAPVLSVLLLGFFFYIPI